MEFIALLDLITISLAIIILLIGIINNALFYLYLKKEKPLVWQSLINKKAIIGFEHVWAIDWLKYCIRRDKSDNKTTRLHKNIFLICVSFTIIFFALSLLLF